jgi:hypothetical protein
MQIKVKIISQFGNKRIFPVCPNAQALAKLAGCKSFTDPQISIIKSLGYAVEVEQEVKTL